MKSLKILFFAVAVLVAATGCKKKLVVPEFGMISVDTLFVNGERQFTVQYEFATISNACESPVLQVIESSNIRRFFQLEEFGGTAQEALGESLTQTAAEFAADDVAAAIPSEEIVCSTSTAELVDSVLVYTISYSSYTGGAHGRQGIAATNYSLKDGYELTLDDLFDEQQRARLSSGIREKLYAEYNVQDDKGLAEAGFFPEYIGVTDNFALTPEGITFYYNPYDIGCYALGGVEVAFTCEELQGL